MSGEESGGPGTDPDYLVVGHISKPHGTRGEVFVWPLTDRPEDIFAAGHAVRLGDTEGALDDDAPDLEVERTPRPFKRGLLVKFVGLDDRDGTDPLAGRYLLVPVGMLAPLEDDEVFYHQLLGMAVQTVDGEAVGTVREVFETEPAHLLQVRGEDGKEHLIPYTKRIVKTTDVEGRRLVIKPPPGLLEL